MRSLVRGYLAAYAGLPASVWWLCLAMVVNRAGTMVLPFLTLYLRDEIGLTEQRITGIVLAYGVGSVLGSYLGGRLSDVFDSLRVMVGSLALAGVGFPLLLAADEPAELIAGFFLLAAVGDALRPAAMSAATRLSTPETRTRGLALLRLAANLGMAIGPALGGLAATYDYAILFVGDGATNLLAAIVVFCLARRTMGRQLARSSGTDDTRARSRAERDGPFLFLLASVFLLCVVFFQVFFVMPLVFRDLYGFDESIIGPMLALNAVLIALFEMPIVRAVEHRNHAVVFTVGAALVAVGVAATGVGSSIGFAALTVCVWTLGEMLSLPMANALVAQRGEKAGAVGAYMGMFTAAFALSSVVGPPLGLLAYSELGAGALFASVLAVGVTLVAMGWPLSRLVQPATNENAGAAR